MAEAKKTGKARTAAETRPVRKRGEGVQNVYDALRQSILDLTLPPGSLLDETRLAEQFDLSRTPIAKPWCGSQPRGC